MSDRYSVCVVTHPIDKTGAPAIAGLLAVIESVATVSLVTADFPRDSPVHDEFDVVQVSRQETGDSIPVAAIRFMLNQIRLAAAVARRDEDIVLFFGAVSYLLPILTAKLLGRAVIVEPRGNVPESLYRIWQHSVPGPVAYLLSRPVWLLERIGYAVADSIVTLSPAMADDLGLRRRFGHKLHDHGARPVDVDRFSPSGPYEERPRRVGYVGRLDEEKGIDVLIDVVRLLPDGIEFVFVGDGALRTRIEEALSECIEAGTVRVTGWIDHDEVPEHLAGFRLLVSTAPTEGVPTTVLEAMASGTPAVTVPVGGIPDVVEDGETGVLVEERDPEAVAAAVRRSFDRAEKLATMSDTAREFVVEEYGFETVARRYECVFESVVA